MTTGEKTSSAAEPDGTPDPEWIALLDRARAGGEDAASAVCDAHSRGMRAGVKLVEHAEKKDGQP